MESLGERNRIKIYLGTHFDNAWKVRPGWPNRKPTMVPLLTDNSISYWFLLTQLPSSTGLINLVFQPHYPVVSFRVPQNESRHMTGFKVKLCFCIHDLQIKATQLIRDFLWLHPINLDAWTLNWFSLVGVSLIAIKTELFLPNSEHIYWTEASSLSINEPGFQINVLRIGLLVN